MAALDSGSTAWLRNLRKDFDDLALILSRLKQWHSIYVSRGYSALDDTELQAEFNISITNLTDSINYLIAQDALHDGVTDASSGALDPGVIPSGVRQGVLDRIRGL